MPKKFVEEVAIRAGLDPSAKIDGMTDEQVERIFHAVKELVTDITTGRNHSPIVIMQRDSITGAERLVEALPIITSEAAKQNFKKANSYMEAVDEALSSEILDIGRSTKTVELDRQIAVLEHDLEEQNKAKEAVTLRAAQIRKLAGELMALSYAYTDA